MNFTIEKFAIEGPLLILPKVFGDNRGYLMENFHTGDFSRAGLRTDYVFEIEAYSTKGVLRGMHFQKENQQAKLIRLSVGAIFDVAVDIRRNSATFGKYIAVELSAQNHAMLYLPEGFAHGYCVLTEQAVMHYKLTALYSPKDEGGILWNDPDVGIVWPVENPVLSDKDTKFPMLKEWIQEL